MFMRTGVLATAWQLLGPAPAAAAQTPAILDSIDRYVRTEVARYRIPGGSVAVLHGDSVVLARGYGYANVEHHVPATDSTIYQSGSVGKQFTAARLGTQVVHICYARELGPAPNSLVTVLYGADWRAAGFDFYSY